VCGGLAGLREGSRHCVDSQGASVPCCEWSPSPWARSYMSITGLVLLWTVRTPCKPLVNQARGLPLDQIMSYGLTWNHSFDNCN